MSFAPALLAGGASYRHAADILGVHEWTVRRRYPGLSHRSRPGRRARADISDTQIIDLREAGLSFTEIAASIGASRGLVRGRLSKYGLAADPHGAQRQ